MPITRIRDAKPVELEAPTTGEGDTVAIHAKSGDTHEALLTNGSGALNVAVVSGGGGGDSGVERFSSGFIQNLSKASYVSGATVTVPDYPFYSDLTQFKAAATTGIGAKIELIGQLANGEFIYTSGTFSSGEFLTPPSWAATVVGWRWLTGQDNAPPPTSGQSIEISHWTGSTWLPFLAATTDFSSWRPMLLYCPEGKKIRVTRLSRMMDTAGYHTYLQHWPHVGVTPRGNQSNDLLILRHSNVNYSERKAEGLQIEITTGAIAVTVTDANAVTTYLNLSVEILDV